MWLSVAFGLWLKNQNGGPKLLIGDLPISEGSERHWTLSLSLSLFSPLFLSVEL